MYIDPFTYSFEAEARTAELVRTARAAGTGVGGASLAARIAASVGLGRRRCDEANATDLPRAGRAVRA